jgi:SAM-dependent methyltransferase
MTPVDESKPNNARMYDYWLGGTHNYPADRAAADAVRARRPNIADQALDNKQFQTRAVSYAAGQGVRQFLDIGSGLPTSPGHAAGTRPLWLATHDAARSVVPDAVVAYVDLDPVAVQHSRALLAGGSPQVVAVAGDVRDPRAILAGEEIRAAGFRLDQPACVVLACILHFLDAPAAQGVAHSLVQALAPGSYVAISVGYAPGPAGDDFARAYNAQDGSRIYAHSKDEIAAMFDGLELLPPGLVDAAFWRAERPARTPAEGTSMILAGVGRKLR